MASITDGRFRLLLLVLALALSGCAGAGRGEALVPRFVPETPAPEIVWTCQAGRGIEVSPLSIGSELVVATTDRRLLGVESKTGKHLWRKRIDAAPAGTPRVAGADLIAATGRPDASVYLLDRSSHRLKWKAAAGDANGSAAVFGGVILLATRDGQVYGLSPTDGRSIWVTNLESKAWGWSQFDSSRAVFLVPTRSGKLFAVDARSGEKRWTADLGKPLAGVGMDSSGVAAVSITGELSFVDGRNGKLRWTSPVRTSVSTPPIVTRDLVIVAGLDGSVSAFRTGNGSPAWKKSLGGPFTSPPVLFGDKIAIAAASGQFWLLDLVTGQVVGTVRHPETVIVSPIHTESGWVVSGEHGLVVTYRWKDAT